MDDSISPDEGSTINDGDIPVQVGSLEIDGVRPAVGDVVTLKVRGGIQKIVNETAWVTPETVNDLPMPPETPDASDDELLEAASAHDTAMGAAY